jgi:hypothetical protein
MNSITVLGQAKKHFLPVLIYGLAVSALYIVDLLVALQDSDAYTSEWAITKSIILLCMASGPLGLDQAMVRHTDERQDLFRVALLVAPLSTLVLLLAFHLLSILPFSFATWAAAWLLSVVICATMALRSKQHWVASQANYASWRLGILAFLVASLALGWSISPQTLFLGGAVIGGGVALLTLAARGREYIRLSAPRRPTKTASVTSLFFLADIVIMNLSVSAEQITFSYLGLEGSSAAYFRASTFVLAPIIFAATYAGFVIGPILVQRPQIRDFVRKHLLLAVLGNLAISLALGGVGVSLYAYAVHGDLTKAISPVTCALVLIGFLRLNQGLVAAFVTFLASERRRAAYLLSCLIALLTFLGLTALLVASGVEPILAVACGSLANWSIRAAATAYLAFHERR